MRHQLRSPRTLTITVVTVAIVVAAAVLAVRALGSHSSATAAARKYPTARIGGSGSFPDPLADSTKKLPHPLTADQAASTLAPADSVFTAFLAATPGRTDTAWTFVSGLGDPNTGMRTTSYTPSAKVTAVGYSATPSLAVQHGTVTPVDYPLLDTTWLVTASHAAATAELKRFRAAKTTGRDALYASVHGTVVVIVADAADMKAATTAKALGTDPAFVSGQGSSSSKGALWLNPYGFGSTLVSIAQRAAHGRSIVKGLDGDLAATFGKGRNWRATLVSDSGHSTTWRGTWSGGGALPSAKALAVAQDAVSTGLLTGSSSSKNVSQRCSGGICVALGQATGTVQVLMQSSANLNSGIGGHYTDPLGHRVSSRTQWISLLASDMFAGIANGNTGQSIRPVAVHAALGPDHALTVSLANH